jgi:polysaccharide biosynthesis/export protein
VKKVILSFLLILLITGCKTNKQIVYLQDAGKQIIYKDSLMVPIPDVTLKVGDLLTITVNSISPEASMPFNLPMIPGTNNINSYNMANSIVTTSGFVGSGVLQNYLVDTQGNILFPIIGKIHVVGMTKIALVEYIKAQIFPRYIKEEPIISIRYANFKVSILGEVNKPGVVNIDNEKVSILEAIALAGDLTIYGKRDNILLVRDNNGKREAVRIDLRDNRLINSPYYYLQQNDILYIQPNNPRSRSSALSTAETLSVSVVGTLITLTSLIITITKK